MKQSTIRDSRLFRNQKVTRLFIISFFMIMFAGLISCQKNDTPTPPPPPVQTFLSPDLMLAWNLQIQKSNTLAVNTGNPPPIYSRQFAMFHAAMHDALNAIRPRYATYVYDKLDTAANPSSALSQAVYEVLKAIEPKNDEFKPYDSLLKATLDTIPDGEAKTRGINLGKEVANAILTKRAADTVYTLLFYSPVPPEGDAPGEYHFFPPLNSDVLAGWYKQQTWIVPSADLNRPGPPDALTSDTYAADFNEVKDLGKQNSTVRTADQTNIAIFWAENTSRGWNDVAREVVATLGPNSKDAWEMTRFFAVLHIAIADAYISVFEAKNHYYYWRPISAIHMADTDGNDKTIADPTWNSLLITPGIPDYPSAHAWTGASAGQVLIRFMGTPKATFTATSGYLPGVTMSYTSVNDAIRANSLSRIYIGYHSRKAVMAGEESGYKTGDYVWDHALPAK